MALLTRKNLTNFVDISPLTLFRHAKDVKANFKKAYAICVREDSHYKGYKKIFLSGNNRESYLEWLREEMNGEIAKIVLEGKTDEDLSTIEVKEEDTKNIKGENNSYIYFKGYIAFSLWGLTPPSGGEELKSSIIHAIENPKRGADKSGGKIAKNQLIKIGSNLECKNEL